MIELIVAAIAIIGAFLIGYFMGYVRGLRWGNTTFRRAVRTPEPIVYKKGEKDGTTRAREETS